MPLKDASTPLDKQPRVAKGKKKDMQGMAAKATASATGSTYSTSRAVSRRPPRQKREGQSMMEFDPQLVASFQRNLLFFQRIFSLDTFLRPLPPGIAQSIARSIGFFTRIFTQFWDPRGIKDAQTAMGIRRKEASKVHRRIKDKDEE